jgi:ribosome-associated toxin RatA of RatAB toxin-antitoxin module
VTRAIVLALLLALGSGLSALGDDKPIAAAPKPALEPVKLGKLRAGVVLVDSTDEGAAAGSVLGYCIAKVAPAAVFAVLTDHTVYPQFMPRIEATQVSRHTDTGERVLQTVNASISTVKYTLDYAWSREALRVEFKLANDVPNDIKATTGHWQLWELDGGKTTLIEYQTSADIGRSVPGFIKRWLQEGGVKDAMDAIRKRAESGGTYRK